jgi:hypothetical protein
MRQMLPMVVLRVHGAIPPPPCNKKVHMPALRLRRQGKVQSMTWVN